MKKDKARVIVAGHICLDIIPDLSEWSGGIDGLLAPGKLVNVGSALIATGGTVSNTGLALHRLGIEVDLMGKVGRDLFGQGVLDILRRHAPALADGMIVSDSDATSYTVVINPPGVDRIFLHCPGANDTFNAEDVNYDKLTGAKLFHFGYPPLMRQMYLDNGAELAAMMQRVKAAGLTTSLDMAFVDPASEAGRVDWPVLLARTLPHVDVFLPSIEEILFMLNRERFERMRSSTGGADIISQTDGDLLAELSRTLIELGAAVVVFKLGDQGLYLRTTADAARLEAACVCASADPQAWTGRELLAPCFEVDVVGTTGAGDCTIAGFLAALVHGLAPAEAMTSAVAAGACNVEAADATSGIPPWSKMKARITAGWKRRPVALSLPGWKHEIRQGIYIGPNDNIRKT
jgi:sugar/nucleoside kinase (ribokinase family)